MKYVLRRKRLLKAGSLKLKQSSLDDLEIVKGDDVLDVLRLCDNGNIMFNDKLQRIHEVDFYPFTGIERQGEVMTGLDSDGDVKNADYFIATEDMENLYPFLERITTLPVLDLNAEPVSFSFEDYAEGGSPLITEVRTISYEPLEERVECKSNEILFTPNRIYLKESFIGSIEFVSGEKALENLTLSNDEGEFFGGGKWLGTIGSIEYDSIVRKEIISPHKFPIFVRFDEYVELRRFKYILVGEEKIEYEALAYDYPEDIDIEFEEAERIN